MPRYQTTLCIPVTCAGMEGDIEVDVDYAVTWGAPETPPAYAHGGLPADPDEIDDVKVLKVDGREPTAHEARELSDHIANSYDAELLEHAAGQDAEGPDPDDLRDQAFDDQLWD
jgi:hypothetical protein